jgi:hypothetical protein
MNANYVQEKQAWSQLKAAASMAHAIRLSETHKVSMYMAADWQPAIRQLKCLDIVA